MVIWTSKEQNHFKYSVVVAQTPRAKPGDDLKYSAVTSKILQKYVNYKDYVYKECSGSCYNDILLEHERMLTVIY